jgi:Ca2+-binding EF-hand superfamily protein
MFWRIILALVVVSATSAAAPQAQAQRRNADAFIQQWDTDHDGTLSLEEVNKAATVQFQSLDRKQKGYLTRSQLAGKLTYQQFQHGKTGGRTLNLSEFLSIVEKLFRTADKDNDGTLDKTELKSSAGKALLRLFSVRQGPVI